jgi:hypothetical protein
VTAEGIEALKMLSAGPIMMTLRDDGGVVDGVDAGAVGGAGGAGVWIVGYLTADSVCAYVSASEAAILADAIEGRRGGAACGAGIAGDDDADMAGDA